MTTPTPPQPAAGSGAAGTGHGMPVSVRVAVLLLGALAVLLVLSGVLTWLGRDGVVDRFLDAQPQLSRDEVTRFVLIGLLRDLLVGVVAAVAALHLTRRRAWARWTGIAAAAVLGVLTLVSVAAAGGTTLFSLLLFVLCVGTVSSLLARTTAAWAPGRARNRT